jgi:alkylation response protein AidB-like acyl-CoA dehydrogenase
VFGGIGYVEETGIAQRWRDSRIAPIYEGTNGIQAIDLVARKLPRDGGAWIKSLMGEMSETAQARSGQAAVGTSADALGEALDHLGSATDWMLQRIGQAPRDALAGAEAYLELLAVTVGGWLMVRRAQLPDGGSPATTAAEARCYAVEVLTSTAGLLARATAGAGHLDDAFDHPSP